MKSKQQCICLGDRNTSPKYEMNLSCYTSDLAEQLSLDGSQSAGSPSTYCVPLLVSFFILSRDFLSQKVYPSQLLADL